jgi:hypothetical protein
MPDNENNCPSCLGDTDAAFGSLTSNPNVFVRPYVPPTQAELEFSRNFYTAMESHPGHDPGAGILVQTTITSQGQGAVPMQTGVQLPAGSIVARYPGPALEHQSTLESLMVGVNRHAVSGEDLLMPSQLTAPWLEPHDLIHTQQQPAGEKIPGLDDVFPNDTPKDEILRKDEYAAGAGKYWLMGRIAKDDDPHTVASIRCDASAHYFEFDFSDKLVLTAELSYWAEAKARGAIVKYPAIPGQPGPTGWPAVPEQIVEERPPASDATAEKNVQTAIDKYLKQEWFDDKGHYAGGAMSTNDLDRHAREAFRKHKECARNGQCRMEFKVLRRKFNVIQEVGKGQPPKWRRGTDPADYEWETDAAGRQVAKRQKIYIEFKVTIYVSVHYWVVVKCIPV